jgi:lysine 6-dehydrogenase
MKILVLGAGRMGYGAAFDLVHNSPGVEAVTVADFHQDKAEETASRVGTSRITAAQGRTPAITPEAVELFRGHDSVISCCQLLVQRMALEGRDRNRANFCDLGGNNYVVDKQLALDADAKAAGINIIPDCGLAPGMVSILAMHGAKQFDKLDEIHIRVGGLPQNPQPPLGYQLVFSVEGLINEYVEVARVTRNGCNNRSSRYDRTRKSLFRRISSARAFQTSGGTSTLPDTFLGKVKELDYKTIRYAGHCDRFKTMIDLGLWFE